MNVLYLSKDGGSPSVVAKMAGIQRYCQTHGWTARLVSRPAFTPNELAAILGQYRPVGCVVDGVATPIHLPPRLFRDIPVSFIGYKRSLVGNHPNFHFNTRAIVEAAFRELSANKPPCYAAVGRWIPSSWSKARVRAFRDVVRAAGSECRVFPIRPRSVGEPENDFVRRLAPWLSSLPEHCAMFVVSDEVAVRVAEAAHRAARPIPRSLTLVSVDNFPDICETANPPISSIQLDFERIGYIAAEALDGTAARKIGEPEASPGPLLVVRRKSTSGHGRREKFILDAVEMIRREACNGLTAAALAARFRGSRNLFERRFREATGHSVLDEILHVRLEKVFTLLARTDTPISAVAALCGFRTDIALHKLFRSRTGLSMSAWRRMSRG